MSSNVYIFCFFLFRCFINLLTDEAVRNIIAQASGITKLIFMRWKRRNAMSSPIPAHNNNGFWLFRDKFVLHKGFKNERAIDYLKIVVFLTILIHSLTKSAVRRYQYGLHFHTNFQYFLCRINFLNFTMITFILPEKKIPIFFGLLNLPPPPPSLLIFGVTM